MNIPEQFANELNDTFHGRFRLRWSDRLSEFHLEQRVAQGQVLPPPEAEDGTADTYADEWIRARDGYRYVMAIRTGDRMPCPVDGLTLPVPVMETREVVCEWCRASGRDGRYRAAYYPLNHVLIEHIRSMDPYQDGAHRVAQRVRQANESLKLRKDKAAIDDAEARVLEDKFQIEDRPMTGYGPKTAQRHEGLADRLR